jgi:hypothetical protein
LEIFTDFWKEILVILDFVLVDIRIKSDIRKCIECHVPECDREAAKTKEALALYGLLRNGKELGIVIRNCNLPYIACSSNRTHPYLHLLLSIGPDFF